MCAFDYTLNLLRDEDGNEDDNYGKCEISCSLSISDFFCNTCYKYNYFEDG